MDDVSVPELLGDGLRRDGEDVSRDPGFSWDWADCRGNWVGCRGNWVNFRRLVDRKMLGKLNSYVIIRV